MPAIQEMKNIPEEQLLADAARLNAFRHPIGREGNIVLCRVDPGFAEASLRLDRRIGVVEKAAQLKPWLQNNRGHMLLITADAGLSTAQVAAAIAAHPTLKTVFIACK